MYKKEFDIRTVYKTEKCTISIQQRLLYLYSPVASLLLLNNDFSKVNNTAIDRILINSNLLFKIEYYNNIY